MQANRVCKTCGKKYFYCSNCDKKNNSPEWMLMWHDENCKNIFEAVSLYIQKKISKEDANKRLQKCDLKVLYSFPDKIRGIIEEIIAEEKPIVENKNVEVPQTRPLPKRSRNQQKKRN